MFYIDSHIHLQDYTTTDIKNVVIEATKNNVLSFVNVSSHPTDWDIVINLSKTYPQIISAIGLHPWYINEAPLDWANILENKLKENTLLWIGECGMDRIKNPNTQLQEEAFLIQAQLANKYSRPLIIHSVKADSQMYKHFSILPRQTIFHSYTGSAEWGKSIQRHGFYIGINFSILRKKDYANIISQLDISRILLETDGPYQSLKFQQESKTQELSYLAQQLATIFNTTTEDIVNHLYQNWLNFNRR